MADLIGGPNGPSLGYGIGLGKEFGYGGINQISKGIQMGAARRARDEAAKSKQAEDADKDYEKFFGNVKITKGHPIFTQRQTEETAKFYSNLAKHHRERPQDYPLNDSKISQEYAQWQANRRADENQQAAYSQFDNTVNDALKNPDLYDVDQKALGEYNASMNQGAPTQGWKDITGNDLGYINPQDVTNKILKKKPQDYLPVWRKTFPESAIPTTIDKDRWVDGQFIKGTNKETFDSGAADVLVNQELENPYSVVARKVLFQTNGDKAKAHDILFNDLQARSIKKNENVLSERRKEYGPEDGQFNGNTWKNDKVRVQYNDINGKKTWDFSGIRSDLENKPLSFTVGGQVISGVPIKFEQKKANEPPVLKVAVPEIKEAGIVTQKASVMEIPYDIAAPKVENEYGFNPYTIQAGINPEFGKQKTVIKKESEKVKSTEQDKMQGGSVKKVKKTAKQYGL